MTTTFLAKQYACAPSTVALRALSIKDATNIFPLSEKGLRLAIQRGEIRAIRIGRRVLIPASEVDRLLRGGDDA